MRITPYIEPAKHETGAQVFNICNLTQEAHISIVTAIQNMINDLDGDLSALRKISIDEGLHQQCNHQQVIDTIEKREKEKNELNTLLKKIYYRHGV